ncbi:hypothetical protein B0J12DRAFT_730034 [Macrophomina phaseolina]|uniref:RNA helicase n=1 Tax=Macrophomina phaseolina TaxID=35725 RepID=A0ABQ8G8G6_9PEZI|nr:hypothetical protein B0J12DRAFT_730034 [Macrophomina phaseolina]
MPSDRHRRDHCTRSRSRSPHHDRHDTRTRTRTRSRSPSRRHHHHHHSRSQHHHDRRNEKKKKKHAAAASAPASLPLNARPLSKHDYARYAPMFALYLDIQKQKILEELDEAEVKGRWKSFVGKWNRGELAEGWYDPATLQKAIASAAEEQDESEQAGRARGGARQRQSPDYGAGPRQQQQQQQQRREQDREGDNGNERRDGRDDDDNDEDDDDEFGPAAMPGFVNTRRSGPAVPRLEDLEMRDELNAEDTEARTTTLRALRRADRALQKERLEEIAPRADPGSRERQLEKRAATTAVHRAFRDAKSPGAEEVGEGDLMGGGDGVDDFRARKSEAERRKNEREIRKEEMLRARAAEREEKLAEHRAKEERTMEMLRALARARFGGGGGGGDGGQGRLE